MKQPLRTLGLWGDGDELDAVADAELRLGYSLPVSDAPKWLTVGDIYDSIILRQPELAGLRTWTKLRTGLCQAVGVDPRLVQRETTLIERTSIWRQLAKAVGKLMKRKYHA